MRCRFVIALLALFLLTTPLMARQGMVKTKDGNTFDGDVSEDPVKGNVTIIIHGISYTVKQANVESISYADDIAQEIRTKAGQLPPNDTTDRLALAQYAIDNHAPMAARDVLLEVQRIDPNNAAARDMLERVNAEMRASAPPATVPAAASAVVPAPAAPPLPAGAPPIAAPAVAPVLAAPPANSTVTRMVTPDEINWIRQAELRSGDTVRVRIDADLRRKFADYMGMPLGDLNKMSPIEQAFLILDKGTGAMKRSVKILSDPPVIAQYRHEVQRTVLTGCATSKCHGGSEAGRFRLFPQADSDPATYTNFIILQQYSANVPGQHGLSLMIDRQTPQSSLLLQYMLPPGIADTPHPEAKGYHGIVRGPTEMRFGQVLSWIRDGLNPVAPDYSRIDLSRPPTTQPADASAR
jgi:hypothetical protein